jgi:alkylhydroperoxidase/carboxymuconolactone decarboxylase family protein YurZ
MENYNNIHQSSEENADEIYNEIIRMLYAGDKNVHFAKNSVLSNKLKNMIALGSLLATQQSYKIASCIEDCLKAGATKEQIMYVLQLTILIAEIPVHKYTEILKNAIQSFEKHSL